MNGVAVVTLAAGRRSHLARLLEGMLRQEQPADHIVIVRMDEDPIDVPAQLRSSATEVTVLDLPVGQGADLPLAAARNLGARAATESVLILLDVDCIPGSDLVSGYARAAGHVDGLICGEVRYLAPGIPGSKGSWTEQELVAASRPHPARPQGTSGVPTRQDRHELAWTTSLALRRSTFDRIGGFDERFVGYGGEDTDFAERARHYGIGVWWSRDPVAYHQHHSSENPPVQHVRAIVRNAQHFATVHGYYPMHGWLEQFRDRGLVEFDQDRKILKLRSLENVSAP